MVAGGTTKRPVRLASRDMPRVRIAYCSVFIFFTKHKMRSLQISPVFSFAAEAPDKKRSRRILPHFGGKADTENCATGCFLPSARL
jgi:hypothetical protein